MNFSDHNTDQKNKSYKRKISLSLLGNKGSITYTELGLGDQMALEVGYIAVEHRQRDDAGDDGRRRDDDGEEGDAAHLPVLLRLAVAIHEDDRLLELVHRRARERMDGTHTH